MLREGFSFTLFNRFSYVHKQLPVAGKSKENEGLIFELS